MKRTTKLWHKLLLTAFIAFCSYTTYAHKLPPYVWLEHVLLLVHTWSDTGYGILVATAFWPLSLLYFLAKYTATWSHAKKTVKNAKPKKHGK